MCSQIVPSPLKKQNKQKTEAHPHFSKKSKKKIYKNPSVKYIRLFWNLSKERVKSVNTMIRRCFLAITIRICNL